MSLKKFETEFTKVNRMRNSIRTIKDGGSRKGMVKQIANTLKEIKAEIREYKQDLKKDEKKRGEYLKLLTLERQRGVISTPDEYELNQAEYDQLEKDVEKGGTNCGRAKCINKIAPGWQIETGDEVLFRHEFNEEKAQNVYMIYSKIEKQPEDQIGKQLEWKMKNGYMPEDKDWLPVKTIIRRNRLVETQFKIYFEEI